MEKNASEKSKVKNKKQNQTRYKIKIKHYWNVTNIPQLIYLSRLYLYLQFNI